MDKPIGFLESEFERVIAARGATSADENVVPITEPLRAQATLRERERRFRELLDALPAAIYTTDAAGRLTYYNEAAVELWGHRPMLGSSEWCGSWKLFWPDGTPMPHDACPMAIALKEDRAVRGLEAACERPDGTRVPFIPYPTPLHDESGKLIGAVNMLVDITERKRTEEQQALLVRELHHRVKNTLATVQAIMGSTARSSETIEDFKNALIGRIGSLAKTHLLAHRRGLAPRPLATSCTANSTPSTMAAASASASVDRMSTCRHSWRCRSAWRCTSSPPMRRNTARCRSLAVRWTLPGP